MIHNIHGAPHHSKVMVGETKRLVSASWEQLPDSDKQFKGWYHVNQVSVVEGTVSVIDSVDSNGFATKDVRFESEGTAILDVVIGAAVRRLVIEVVSNG